MQGGLKPAWCGYSLIPHMKRQAMLTVVTPLIVQKDTDMKDLDKSAGGDGFEYLSGYERGHGDTL